MSLADLPDAFSAEATKSVVNVVPMNFRTDYAPVSGKMGEFKEIERVDLVKRGTNGESTPWTIRALKQDNVLWPAIEPAYARWKAGQEEPVEGTPLDVLPFIPRGAIAALKLLLVRTAEDLAGLNDADMDRVGMGARMWREKARMYLDSMKGTAGIIEAKAELEQANEQLRGEIAEMRDQIAQLMADKPKRGRPRNTE